jgi:hypothetical protein
MILTPAAPSAGPTGGAGFAFPAAICSFMIFEIFFCFAIVDSPSLNQKIDSRTLNYRAF